MDYKARAGIIMCDSAHCTCFSLIEYGVGWLSNSLVLVVDSGHMFIDCLAMVLSLAATALAQSSTLNRTVGTHKAEIIAATANGFSLLVLAVWVTWEAVQRFQIGHPVVISGAERCC